MAIQMQSISFILPEKFEKPKFATEYLSEDTSSTPSTPSTPFSPITEPFEISPITKDEKGEVIQFLRRFFIRDEPLNLSLALIDTDNPTCSELEEYSAKDLDSGLNLKAASNGRIIGVCLNSILHRGFIDNCKQHAECPNKKFEKILNLLNYVAVKSDVFSHYPGIDKAMSVRILSVDGAWRGRGIGKELMDRTREIAKKMGCKLMSVDCTSHFTARALKKLGFQCLYSLDYSDYKVDGETVFHPEAPHKAVTVYTQIIG